MCVGVGVGVCYEVERKREDISNNIDSSTNRKYHLISGTNLTLSLSLSLCVRACERGRNCCVCLCVCVCVYVKRWRERERKREGALT